MIKEIVQNWMRLAWRANDQKEIANIPAEALAILKEQEPKHEAKKPTEKAFKGLV